MTSLRLLFPGMKELGMSCTGYTLGLSSSVQSATLATAKVHLPIKVSQQAIRFSVSLNSQKSLKTLQSTARQFHLSSARGVPKPCRVMYVSSLGKDGKRNPNNPNILVYGYLLEITGGAKKFDFSPQVTLVFQLVKDLVSETTSAFSNSTDPANLVPSDGLIEPGNGNNEGNATDGDGATPNFPVGPHMPVVGNIPVSS